VQLNRITSIETNHPYSVQAYDWSEKPISALVVRTWNES